MNEKLTVPTDKGPIMLTDHFHRDYLSIVEDVVGTDVFKVVRMISLPCLHVEAQRDLPMLYTLVSFTMIDGTQLMLKRDPHQTII